MANDLFVGLFQNYLDAVKYQIDENSKKLDFSRYQEQHADRIADLEKAQKIGDETKKSNEMKKINDKYFQYVKHVIFDLPTIPIKNDEEEILPIEENLRPDEYMDHHKVIPLDVYKPSISVDPINLLVNAVGFGFGGGNSSSKPRSALSSAPSSAPRSVPSSAPTTWKYSTTAPKSNTQGNTSVYESIGEDVLGGSSGCAGCMVGGKSPGVKFTDSRTKKYHNYLMVFYNIILHQYYEESADAWKIVETYTEKMNELEYEYKKGTGDFVDFPTGKKDIKFESSLRKIMYNGYKELNAIASRLKLGTR